MTTAGKLHILRIEIDGHWHGSSNVPRPWVAEITGADEKFGLKRKFVQPMNDWQNAHKAGSGNIYGVVATFALRDGNMYEVCRARGNPSKRHLVREFVRIENGKRVPMTADEAIVRADGGGEATILTVAEGPDTWVADVRGLGVPRRIGWVVLDGRRRYAVREGRVYEAVESGLRRLVGVRNGVVTALTDDEAMSWLSSK